MKGNSKAVGAKNGLGKLWRTLITGGFISIFVILLSYLGIGILTNRAGERLIAMLEDPGMKAVQIEKQYAMYRRWIPFPLPESDQIEDAYVRWREKTEAFSRLQDAAARKKAKAAKLVWSRKDEDEAFAALKPGKPEDTPEIRKKKGESYQAFLKQWADGRHAGEVSQIKVDAEKTWEDHDFEQLQEIKIEYTYSETKLRSTKKEYEKFIKIWPNGAHRKEVCGRITIVEQKIDKVIREQGNEAFDKLSQITEHDMPLQRRKKLEEIESFIKNFSTSSHLGDAKKYLDAGRKLDDELTAAEEFKKEVDNVIKRSQRCEELSEAYYILNNFQMQHPYRDLPRHQQADGSRVVVQIDSIRKEAARDWDKLNEDLGRMPGQYSKQIQLLDDFKQTYPPFYTDKIKIIKGNIEIEWDKSVYEDIRSKLNSASKNPGLTEDDIRNLRQKMDKYRGRGYPEPAMREAVETWINWFEKIAQSGKVIILIERLDSKKGKCFDRWNPFADLHLKITLDTGQSLKKSIKQEAKDGFFRCDFDTNLTYDNYTLGSPIPVTVFGIYDNYTLGSPIPATVFGIGFSKLNCTRSSFITAISREVPLEQDGTLYVRVENQPVLPEYHRGENHDDIISSK